MKQRRPTNGHGILARPELVSKDNVTSKLVPKMLKALGVTTVKCSDQGINPKGQKFKDKIKRKSRLLPDRQHHIGGLSDEEVWHLLQGNEYFCKEDPTQMS